MVLQGWSGVFLFFFTLNSYLHHREDSWGIYRFSVFESREILNVRVRGHANTESQCISKSFLFHGIFAPLLFLIQFTWWAESQFVLIPALWCYNAFRGNESQTDAQTSHLNCQPFSQTTRFWKCLSSISTLTNGDAAEKKEGKTFLSCHSYKTCKASGKKELPVAPLILALKSCHFVIGTWSISNVDKW